MRSWGIMGTTLLIMLVAPRCSQSTQLSNKGLNQDSSKVEQNLSIPANLKTKSDPTLIPLPTISPSLISIAPLVSPTSTSDLVSTNFNQNYNSIDKLTLPTTSLSNSINYRENQAVVDIPQNQGKLQIEQNSRINDQRNTNIVVEKSTNYKETGTFPDALSEEQTRLITDKNNQQDILVSETNKDANLNNFDSTKTNNQQEALTNESEGLFSYPPNSGSNINTVSTAGNGAEQQDNQHQTSLTALPNDKKDYGKCDFPWQLDSDGRRCGGRAASERSNEYVNNTRSTYSAPNLNFGSTYVRGYFRKDGTYVRGHSRRRR